MVMQSSGWKVRWLLKIARGFALATRLGNEKGENLNEGNQERFRRAVEQLLWLAGDRPDLRYAVTLLAIAIHQPTRRDWSMLEKVVRYLG
eukprot:3209050-Amphidinium_carterae.3